MKNQDKIEKLKETLSKNEIDRTIEELLKITKGKRKDLHNEVLIISSKHEKNKSEYRQGVEESSKINIENARIVKSLLQIIDFIEAGKRGNFKPNINFELKNIAFILSNLFSLITLLMGIFFLYFRFDVISEAFKGAKNIDYAQLILPFLLLGIGLLILYKTLRK